MVPSTDFRFLGQQPFPCRHDRYRTGLAIENHFLVIRDDEDVCGTQELHALLEGTDLPIADLRLVQCPCNLDQCRIASGLGGGNKVDFIPVAGAVVRDLVPPASQFDVDHVFQARVGSIPLPGATASASAQSTQ